MFVLVMDVWIPILVMECTSIALKRASTPQQRSILTFFKNIQWNAFAARLEKVAKGLTHWIDATRSPQHWGRSPQCHASIRIPRNAA